MILSRLEKIAEARWFAYGSIFLIQVKLLWGIWDYRDLTNGDTSSYFRVANQWADDLYVDFTLSPLYNIFYGSLTWLVPDAYDVTILHRIIIVLAASLLVLAVLRRLLPAGIAWVLALWWTLLPINFDTLYEVHLFTVLLTLAAVLVALSLSGLWMRVIVFFILLAAGLLVRTELLVAVLAWAAVWIGYEAWRWRRGEIHSRPAKALAAHLAVPVLFIAAALAVVVPSLAGGESSGSAGREQLILCQNYFVGADQRGEFPSSLETNKPLTCERLMRALFGSPMPTWSEAIRANPGAMADHLLWNAQLIPQAIELMLFDQISGSLRVNPDDVPVITGSRGALVGLAALTAFVSWGLVLLWRERRRWWEDWLRERAWGWAVLGCLAAAALVVMVMVRPRPSYLFNLSVLLLAVIGMCALVIGSRRPWLGRLRAAIPLLAAVILIAVPSRYNAHYVTPQAGQGRPLLEMVERLEPSRNDLSRPTAHLLAPQFAQEACFYIVPEAPCLGTSLLQAIGKERKGTSLGRVVKRREINLIYADELIITNPSTRELLERLQRKGWQPLGPSPSSGEWTLLRRPTTAPTTS